jgi:uncharacterized protein YutE (UPF0331/DUF86 family)
MITRLLAMDGSIKIIKNVKNVYDMGFMIIIETKDGVKKYYNNFKILSTKEV